VSTSRNSADIPPDAAEETAREEVRPGLVMTRRRRLKEDGRSLLRYEFTRSDTREDPVDD